MPRQQNSNLMKIRCSAMLDLWDNGEWSQTAISLMIKILIKTVNYKIKNIKEQGTIEDRPRKGRPHKINASYNIALGQWIRLNNESTSKELAQKLLYERDLNMSKWTVRCQFQRLGYTSILRHGTPMLTKE